MTDVATVAVSSAPTKTKKRLNWKKALFVLIALAVLAGMGYLGYQYMQAQKQISKLKNPTEAAKVETDELLKKVAKVVELPGGETPTVATVVDAGKLRSQGFFARSENGDKVLMYTTAKKAYLFRPSTGKLIEVAPIDIGKGTNATTTTPPAKK